MTGKSLILSNCNYYFFFFLSGHAKTVDIFLSDSIASYYETAVRDRIVFHDESIKILMLPIALATEIVSGVENLWKVGPSVGCLAYPDFGRI
jgi:hypothetical protein